MILNTVGVGSVCDNIVGWFGFPKGIARCEVFAKGQVAGVLFKGKPA